MSTTKKLYDKQQLQDMIEAINLSITDLCVQIEVANQHLGATYQYTWRVEALRKTKAILEQLLLECTQVHDLEL